MNKEDVIRMARGAGLPIEWISETGVLKWSDLERFAFLIAAAERETCISEVRAYSGIHFFDAAQIVEAILARVEK